MIDWQSRIVELRKQRADQFNFHPDNPKIHPEHQTAALAGAISEIGFIKPVIVNKRTGNLIDGHDRVALALRNNEMVDYILIDIPPEKEPYALMTLDAITYLAKHDATRLEALMQGVQTADEAVMTMLESLAASNGLIPPDNPYEEWVGMPEFDQAHLFPIREIIIKFQLENDVVAFAKLIGQNISDKTKWLWFPPKEAHPHTGKVFVENESEIPDLRHL